ncbi:helix-turn-helix domain-containing protein [Blastomonas sp.]|uniref:helix-turn-helix domain-containing protein n=1 Tax=Blastomonas sp. TaxID=1909299 RepID=UPI0035949470
MSDDMINDDDFAGLVSGLRDVAEWRLGQRDGFIARVPETIDVRAIRKAEQMTQADFARTYGFSVAALRDWEQNRRQPERSARILLAMIAREPLTVRRVLKQL